MTIKKVFTLFSFFLLFSCISVSANEIPITRKAIYNHFKKVGCAFLFSAALATSAPYCNPLALSIATATGAGACCCCCLALTRDNINLQRIYNQQRRAPAPGQPDQILMTACAISLAAGAASGAARAIPAE